MDPKKDFRLELVIIMVPNHQITQEILNLLNLQETMV